MKKYEKNVEERKVLVTRLSNLTGLDAHYTRVPRCAYEIGPFTVEKDGTLAAEDNADQSIIDTLIRENLIKAANEPDAQTEPGLEQAAQEFETEDWEEDDWSESEGTSADGEAAQEIWRPETDIFERQPQTIAEGASQDDTPCQEAPDTEREALGGDRDTEAPEGGHSEDGNARMEEPAEPLETTIAFPIYQHTSASLVNLVCMIYSRGLLLSKATGGEFYASKELVDALLDHPAFTSQRDVVDFLRNRDIQEQRLVGLSFTDEQVVFDGFGAVRDAGHLQTFMRLAAAMNKMAVTQKRVQAKEVNGDNEKYALRVWLIRLGMNGSGCKEDRKRLMKNLTGHTAFRKEADRVRWEARQAAKREALKAAKMAGQPEGSNV